MSTPIDFKTEKDTMSKILEHINLDLLYSVPYVSGSMLNSFFSMLAPYSVLQKKYLTLIAKQDDPEFVEKFMLMENWRMDSPRVSGPVLAEFIHVFYHSNAFYNEFIEFKSIKLKLNIVPLGDFGEKRKNKKTIRFDVLECLKYIKKD